MITAFQDWIAILLRWLHLMAGIAWVGTSFYFNWFDLSVRPPKGKVLKENIRGTLDEIHGGSFYYHEQYWPDTHPERLLVHAWPAKTTLITGILLLTGIYWHGARTYLIDPSVADLPPIAAIGISFVSLVACWFFYDLLCFFADSNRTVFVVMSLFVALAAWCYQHVFSGRAAYIHVGAMLGTCMGLNVWTSIVPHHIAMRKRLMAGQPIDKKDGEKAKRRSQHNNYFTLPVTFAMISNHFALAYNHHRAWLILCLLMAGGVSIRHYLNVLYKEDRKERSLLAVVVAAFGGAIGLSFVRPAPPPVVGPVDTPTAMAIVQRRCMPCHSQKPTHPSFAAPPSGFILETPEHVMAKAEKVVQRTSVTRDMPQGNATGMTDEERAQLKVWVEGQGKKP
ncbi:urate hydroxylase PuuD [Polyangium aurulentum]|uniref:urate hydroxylase PuuD n=1 Tax=Polyangium aurulentum TaxID=2567896 RepID=UPI0010AE83C7|nr:urate hydroxylase PuuD [Polyangium aurulentum]UQA62007.1 urate hydroxylase PuuD [Polyangium aurulentum]